MRMFHNISEIPTTKNVVEIWASSGLPKDGSFGKRILIEVTQPQSKKTQPTEKAPKTLEEVPSYSTYNAKDPRKYEPMGQFVDCICG